MLSLSLRFLSKIHMGTRQKTNVRALNTTTESHRLLLDDGAATTVHVVRYLKSSVKPRLVLFDKETLLLDWCKKQQVANAISGGFFLRPVSKPRGDFWINGKKQKTVPSISPWNISRGSLYISPIGEVKLAPRYLLPQRPASDLLEAGPLLVQNNRSLVDTRIDLEGFRASYLNSQNDQDIQVDRYPRLAIATDDRYIYSIAADGYGNGDDGLTLGEFADFMVDLGVRDALNLDGGSSATIIHDGKLFNCPKGGYKVNYAIFPEGRPIFSAIIFDQA